MKYTEKRYDELEKGNVIFFYGAKVKLVDVRQYPYKEEFYKGQTDVVVNFDIEPVDEQAIKILGKGYAYGCYGGVGCLTAAVLSDF